MVLVNTVVMFTYYIITALISFVLIRNIIKTRDAQEVVLYCIILIPFLLRIFHIK